jgi:hypothetical protein
MKISFLWDLYGENPWRQHIYDNRIARTDPQTAQLVLLFSFAD